MGTLVEKDTKRKSGYLEMIKIIAMFMVLYNHRATYNLAEQWVTYDPRHVILQLLATACRIGVPLFFMCSGVVLLGKQESYKDIVRKRLVRILIVMVICTVIKAWGSDWSGYTLADIFFTKLNWYLYAYVDYLLMLPFLRSIAQHTEESMAKIYMVLVCCYYTISGIMLFKNFYTSLIDFAPLFNSQFASICWAVIFPLSGYFLANRKEEMKKQEGIMLIVVAAASLLASALMIIWDLRTTGGVNMDQLRVHFIYVPSLAVFCVVDWCYRALKLNDHPKFNTAVITVSGTTFGMFIIETHSELLYLINNRIAISNLGQHLSSYYQGIISMIVQFVVCFCIVFVLKKLPLLKKIL